MRWDPEQYAKFAGERSRPFFDLVARVGAEKPYRVVDLGCGPGPLTATLADRWPDAVVEGLDSSPEMVERARSLDTRVEFRAADIAQWSPSAGTDVVVSNAALQWVPGHPELVSAWARTLPAGGWLAFQVPGNFGAPSHALLRELAASGPYAGALAGKLRDELAVAEPEDYARRLLAAGLSTDVWETTYLHVLTGPDPVLEWMRGTALRPVLAALSGPDAERFTAELAGQLRAAYPADDAGVVLLPFRRIFAVGYRES
jgi:trans-aconitate 2-methyltransferase